MTLLADLAAAGLLYPAVFTALLGRHRVEEHSPQAAT